MAAIAPALSRVFPTTSIEADPLRNIAIFCGAGLLVSLCVASYGLDLSAGLF